MKLNFFVNFMLFLEVSLQKNFTLMKQINARTGNSKLFLTNLIPRTFEFEKLFSHNLQARRYHIKGNRESHSRRLKLSSLDLHGINQYNGE